MKEVVKILFGSMLYGTNTPDSDYDYKSVYIPSARDILLGRVQKSIRFNSKHEREQQIAGKISRNLPGDIDIESLSLQHFFTLLADGQSMALEMLFVIDESLIKTTPIWSEIQNNKHRLVNRKIEESIRYMNTQSKKYGTKGSRVAECRRFRDLFFNICEINPQMKLREVGDYITTLTEPMEHTRIVMISQPSGVDLEHLECVGKKLPFTITVKEAHNVLNLFMQKYGQRALDAENNQGVDWKALSHAVRVGDQTLELLATGSIEFPRPNSEYLKKIKRGDVYFKEVSETITTLAETVKDYANQSPLPEEIDQEWVDDFVAFYYHYDSVRHYGLAKYGS
jgi:predicted nucleotidyltransferase